MNGGYTDTVGTRRLQGAAFPVALMAALVVLAVYTVPGLTGWMQYDRSGVENGELWRLLTSHWTHWTGEHLLWDLVAFMVLLLCSLRISWRRTLASLAAASLAIPVVVWICLPEMRYYRGLSGLDSALYVLVACAFLRKPAGDGQRLNRWLVKGLMIGFAAKLGYEGITGHTVFVRSMGDGITGVPLAHLTGALVGLALSPRIHASKAKDPT